MDKTSLIIWRAEAREKIKNEHLDWDDATVQAYLDKLERKLEKREDSEVTHMIKKVIRDYLDNNGVKYEECQINVLTETYQNLQEWNEDVMTSGASEGEVMDWLRENADAIKRIVEGA